MCCMIKNQIHSANLCINISHVPRRNWAPLLGQKIEKKRPCLDLAREKKIKQRKQFIFFMCVGTYLGNAVN